MFVCSLLKDAFSVTDYTASNVGIISNESERIRKEAVVA
jgi:hypothetical protein